MSEGYNFKQGFCFIIIIILFSSCLAYREDCKSKGDLYDLIPRKRAEIPPGDLLHYTTWALFGNEDDGIFGEGANYKLDHPNDGRKAVSWWFRNPLHNFTFYVIGSADRDNPEITLFKASQKGVSFLTQKPKGTTVFADKATSLFIGLHGLKPFISLRIGSHLQSWDMYIGWRERGNFGLKCCFRRDKTIPSKENLRISVAVPTVLDSSPLESLPES